jgi:histidine ammonia-lyase
MATRRGRSPVVLDGRSLTLTNLVRVARGGATAALAPSAKRAIARSRALVERALQSDEPTYGVNTGFGAMAGVAIPPAERAALQLNLLRSHAAGVGEPLARDVVRAVILLRANSLAGGLSGVRLVTVERLLDLLRRDIVPIVPAQGSVGASGDLAPLAHLALVLVGEGEAWMGGRRMPGGEALRRAGLRPLALAPKEGLALVNGTQIMTAIGLLALSDAIRVLEAAEVAAAMSIEALLGSHVPFDLRIAAARPHPGHLRVARRMRKLLRQSAINRSHHDCGRVQDAYSLRCVPQVLGASWDALVHIGQVLAIEMNSVTDNPLCLPGPGRGGAILSGGNFHGQPVALALDYLAMAVAEAGSISERRTYKLLDTSRSGLPPFLTRRAGTHSGLMVTQYTAAALVAENKILCHPASVDSIPTCADTEDHVSMGPIAARKAAAVVANVARVVAIELIAAAQALDFRRPLKSGLGVEKARAFVRAVVPPIDRDRELAPAIEAVADQVLQGAYAAIE